MAGDRPITTQTSYRIGNNDSGNVDLCSFDALNTKRAGVVKETPFMVRIQLKNTGVLTETGIFQLYYNDENTFIESVQVGALLDGTVQVDSVNGLPVDGVSTYDRTVVEDISNGLSWQYGRYDEVDGQTPGYSLMNDCFTDHQFCVELTANAVPGRTYYFFIKVNGAKINSYANSAQVQTIEGGPKGPLGHPLTGPLRGPI